MSNVRAMPKTLMRTIAFAALIGGHLLFQHIACHRGVGVANVGHVVDVIDRGGDVEAAHVESHCARIRVNSTRWEILTV